jgi:L-glutamine-phosphate cytidylyltransferase
VTVVSFSTKKAIIVAAGRGRRLGRSTQEIPKCMVKVGGRPILHWQLEALAAAGVTDVVVVRGYLGDRIDAGRFGVRFIDNPAWAENNILASLLYAKGELNDSFYFSYCDIVYAKRAVLRLSQAVADPVAGSLVVDRRWSDAYAGRTLHPVSEAELARVDGAGQRVLQVGKGAVPPSEAVGEFIGLAHFSAEGGKAIAAVWQKALDEGGLDSPFGRAAALRQAYLTDALNAIAESGKVLAPVYINGEWREIDTEQDLASAERALLHWAR